MESDGTNIRKLKGSVLNLHHIIYAFYIFRFSKFESESVIGRVVILFFSLAIGKVFLNTVISY